MRLIDPKTFKLELDELDCIDKFGYVILPITKLNIALERSTVDAMPVVRCKECKWWRGPIYGNRCSYHSGPNHTEFYDADEFCSRGERKGDE